MRILACIGDQGRWLYGRALGRGQGSLTGQISDGATCQGEWTSRNVLGLGQADVTCSDGMQVTVIYFYQDEYTGTARGQGISNRGDKVLAWSGAHVLDYFRNGRPDGTAALRCGEHDIPIS